MAGKKRIVMSWCAEKTTTIVKGKSNAPGRRRDHDRLITTPGAAKFKSDENPMISRLTSLMIQPLYCSIAIGDCSCGKVSQLQQIIRRRNELSGLSLSPSINKPVR